MKYGPLGRSGLIVSRICLGGNSWGAKGRRGWGKFDESEAPAYFKRALDVGITFFDTADTYNFGRSEEIMGATLLKTVRREEIVLSTKVGIRMSEVANDVGTGRKHLMASVDAQLKRLQTDYIDVYQVHRLDPHTPIEETMYTLDQIVRSGKVRYIGGSTMPAYKFAQMVMVADWKGYARPIAMQNLYNLVSASSPIHRWREVSWQATAARRAAAAPNGRRTTRWSSPALTAIATGKLSNA
jgi:1-deoxyxylulose-5-phosphate synthase